MKYTSLANAMRDLSEELAARRSGVIRITEPLPKGAASADASAHKSFVDHATGMDKVESASLAEVAYPELDKAVKEWEQRVGQQAKKLMAEVVDEALKAGRSLGEVTAELMQSIGKHYDVPPGR
jgi:hypothetical protein